MKKGHTLRARRGKGGVAAAIVAEALAQRWTLTSCGFSRRVRPTMRQSP